MKPCLMCTQRSVYLGYCRVHLGNTRIPTRGELIVAEARRGEERVQLREQIRELEKLSRRTPPKTLAAEWAKVRASRAILARLQARLAEIL